MYVISELLGLTGYTQELILEQFPTSSSQEAVNESVTRSQDWYICIYFHTTIEQDTSHVYACILTFIFILVDVHVT